MVYFRYQDKRRPEPLGLLGIIFIMGFSFCLCLGFASRWFYSLEKIIFIPTIFSLLMSASIEELGKFLILRYYAYYQSAFDERIDGIIYGITVGLGFAACENIFYITQNGLDVIVSRFATATLLHAILGGFIGYFLSIKKFTFRISWLWSLGVFILVSIIHFIYNIFLLLYKPTGFIVYREVLLIFALFFILILLIIDTNKRSRLRRLDN